MAIDNRMPTASEQLFDAVRLSTMMGSICGFGEQGTNHHASATHGNLTYGCRHLDAAGPQAHELPTAL